MTTLSQSDDTQAYTDRQPYSFEVLLGESSATKRLRLQVARIAPHFRVALLIGESGVGKQTVAHEMHLASPASSGGFVAMRAAAFAQSAAIPARTGTLYLSGLDTLKRATQARLLQALRAVDRETHVLFASGCDLKGMVSTGRLRSDLYEYIGTLEIRVSPLRERLEDLDLVAQSMLQRTGSSAVFASCALHKMHSHSWPGNLEELHTLCDELAPLRTIEALDLPSLKLPPPTSAATRLEEVIHRHVMDVLQRCSGNKLRAAELLGISRSTLYRMLESQPALRFE